jgi:hypothetical protein
MAGELPGLATGGGHEVKLFGAFAITDKGDLFAVRGVSGLGLICAVLGESGGGATGGRNAPEIATPSEGEGLAIGRKGRIVGQSNGFSGGGDGEEAEGKEGKRPVKHGMKRRRGLERERNEGGNDKFE